MLWKCSYHNSMSFLFPYYIYLNRCTKYLLSIQYFGNHGNLQLSVQAGASLRLKCGAHGSPQPEVMWYKVLKNG